ncbi:MAG: pyrimidine 5'-nucleotidase [Chloroflexi bacterium]|nr:MAG: pyrimidine 5'-nucleotidase [Chloroflexota bacterium]
MNFNGHHPYQYILFDLDDTLYPEESGLMAAIGERITRYMVQIVGIPADDAPLRRRTYYQRYGTSLRGLMVDFNIEPEDFLAFVHNVNPADFFGPSPPLDFMLHELPLRKVIFTNADAPHSERVLNTLQVRAHFEQIFDAHTVNYITKPDPLAYHKVLAQLGVAGTSCIMVDDKPRNLIPAKDLGMTTILVGNNSGASAAIDYAVPTIFHVEAVIKNLLPVERL